MVLETANTGSPGGENPSPEKGGATTAKAGKEGLLDRVAQAIQKRKEPGSWMGRMLKLLGLAHLTLQLGYVLGLAAVLAGMSLVGERNLLTAFFLFLPTHIWLFPLLVLFPLCLLTPQRWICLLQIGLALYVLGPYMGWRSAYPAARPTDKPRFVIMTNNRGQKGDESMSGFIEANNPDLLVFQEAGHRADNYLKGYPQYKYAESDSEFTIVSKTPILETASLMMDRGDSSENGQITANRSVVEVGGKKVAIYNVHMPTPRGALRSLRGPALLHGLISLPGTPWRAGRDDHMRYWDAKVHLAEELRAKLEKEPLPYLVAGDFNMPNQGYLHGVIMGTRGGLTDAHQAAGKGYGFSFPGTTHNPLTLGGPWLRIDYVFASRQWKVQKCITERDRPSQHRAVVAELTLEAD